MKRNIQIEALDQIPLEKQRIELVERKCLGHPDSLADGIAESISQALCRTYLEEFGAVLHHNTDQGEVVAGESCPKFGGGKMVRPMYILLDGRATKHFNGVTIPTDAVAVEAAHTYLHKILPELNLSRDVTIDCRLGTGSTDLRDVFKPCEGKVPRSNDTSFGVGHAPFSEVETIIKSSADFIDKKLRKKYPAVGQDIKIMGLRDRDTITLTVACAIVDKYCADIDEYKEYMELLKEQISAVAMKSTRRKVVVHVDTADDIRKKSVFLTVTDLRRDGRRRLCWSRQPLQRAYYTKPPDEYGGNERKEPDQPHREDLQSPFNADRPRLCHKGRWHRGDVCKAALADR